MEELILVNINDEIVGNGEKMEVHHKGMLHRAFSIFIVNDKGQMLIQKRSKNKYHSGGLWTNSCCSHPRKNEKLADAIHRRLIEEMGFDCELREQFSFIYRAAFSKDLFEYEIDHVFLGTYSDKIVLNKEEATEAKWIEIEELKQDLVEHAERYTIWFISAAPRVIQILEKKVQ